MIESKKDMKLSVVKYGNPVLRKKGERIERVTPEIKRLIEDMLETMHEARGIGLAAQQVGRALQLTVVDVSGVEDRPSTLKVDGESVAVEEYMPIVLLNPEITPLNAPVTGPEGCLSFPEIYADVSRPESVRVKALNESGETVEFECGGLLSRVVQHETDHLHGILYIDRMTKAVKQEIQPQLDQLQAQTKAELSQ